MAVEPNNPFVTGTMITDKTQFIGRRREIAAIISRIRNSDSVSVIGERRIGKSSLLYYLLLTGNERLDDLTKTRYQFLYLDTTSSLYITPADFVMEILTQLQTGFDVNEVNTNPHKALTRGLQKFRQSSRIPVLLLDEFEKLTEKGSLYTDAFFENLRSCCNSHLSIVVSASRITLKDLFTKNVLTSGFWNIFTNISLEEFSNEEVLEFLFHFWKGKLTPALHEQVFLLTYPSSHPLVFRLCEKSVKNHCIY